MCSVHKNSNIITVDSIFVAVCVRALLCCMSLLSAPEQDAECIWHRLARSNHSQSAAGGKGVDVDGMGTENGCVPSLHCRTKFE